MKKFKEMGGMYACGNTKVLDPYYDSRIPSMDEALILQEIDCHYITKMPTKSQKFSILLGKGTTKKGHERRWSVNNDDLNSKNFIRV